MPYKIYETYNPNPTDADDSHATFSFDEADIRSIAKENGDYPVYTHYAHSFFSDLAESIAKGEKPVHDISKKELAELFCELYKV